MNYDKYSEGGRKYVPCVIRLNRPIARGTLPVLNDYLSRMFNNVNVVDVSVVNDEELSVRIYIDAMKLGYTAGELVDRLVGVLEGYQYCLTTKP